VGIFFTRWIQGTRTGIFIISIVLVSILSAFFLWYNVPFPETLKIAACAAWGVFGLCVLAAQFSRYKNLARLCFLLSFLVIVAGWFSIRPSNNRTWAGDVAHTVTGEISGNIVTLHNVRNFNWHGLSDYDQNWETRRYDFSKISSVDLFLSTWGNPNIAHTLVGFGFTDGSHVVFSVEIRKERHEEFSEIAGFFKQYEIALVAADENDIIRTRTNVRKEDVSMYRVLLTPEQAKKLLLSYVHKGNRLAKEPEFYHTLTANCTTVVYDMIRLIVPGIPMDYRILLSGRLPAYIYDLGGLGRETTLQDIMDRASISARAQEIKEHENYSKFIRSR